MSVSSVYVDGYSRYRFQILTEAEADGDGELTLISLAIGTELVWFELEEALDGLLVLRGLLWCSTTRHGELRMVRRV